MENQAENARSRVDVFVTLFALVAASYAAGNIMDSQPPIPGNGLLSQWIDFLLYLGLLFFFFGLAIGAFHIPHEDL